MREIPIIYEDNHLLVVEKPPNILSQGDITGDIDMLTLLKADLKRRYDKPGNVFLGLVHRLDRPVGGTMVFAKTSKAASRLSEQIRRRKFGKKYIAIVHGVLPKRADTLVHHLKKDKSANRVRTVSEGSPGALKAVLSYNVMGTCEGLSQVRVDLHTGRPHQIRVQFAAIGHPLYGDRRYGIKDAARGIALWSHSIVLEHPTLRETMTFTSYPGEGMPWNLMGF